MLHLFLTKKNSKRLPKNKKIHMDSEKSFEIYLNIHLKWKKNKLPDNFFLPMGS